MALGLLNVSGVLGADEVDEIRQGLARVPWHDGKATAGAVARRVKDNEQADLSSSDGTAIRTRLAKAILEHPVVAIAARPRRYSRTMVSRTSGGGHYGPHVDNAFMGKGGNRLRTDLSYTLFLSQPGEYEGGELTFHTAMGEQQVKLDAGDLILYPTSEIHEVRPVTKGERMVAVGWIESTIASAQQRSVLFDLENLRATMRETHPADAAELLTLDKSIANLLRMWGQP